LNEWNKTVRERSTQQKKNIKSKKKQGEHTLRVSVFLKYFGEIIFLKKQHKIERGWEKVRRVVGIGY